MQTIKSAVSVGYPSADLPDDFSFSAVHPDGVFRFRFRFFGGRWNGWATLPSGEVRAFGVLPGVISWAGFPDYGIIFSTSLTKIERSKLRDTTLYVITWE